MKSLSEVHDAVDAWWHEGLVGNLIIYRAPGASTADCIIERVVKCREMKPEIRAALEMVMDELGVERGEMARDSKGNPDRIKLTRRFDG
jgi:hypothetical protein